MKCLQYYRPDGAATLAAYRNAVASGFVGADERAVLFNCGPA